MRFHLKSLLPIIILLDPIVAWTVKARDGSVEVDAYNLLLCMLAGGYPNETIVGISDNSGLVVINSEGVSNRAAADYVALQCKQKYGYSISLSAYRYSDYADYYTELSSITQFLNGDVDIPKLSRDEIVRPV